MEKIYSFIFLFLFMFSCTISNDREKNKFEIKGHLTDLKDGQIFLAKAGKYLDYTFKEIDSTQIIDGEFYFSGALDFPEMYYLLPKKGPALSIFMEPSAITIEGNADDEAEITISGSALHDRLVRTESELDSIAGELGKWAYIRQFVESNSSSELSPYLILKYVFNTADYEELEAYYNLLAPSLKEHPYTQQIIEQLAYLKAVRVGEISQDFTSLDTLGNQVKLSDFKGSFVLIDFWASWCGPCRKENPHMVEFYNELKKKYEDFEIVGVGAEFDEGKWKRAIRDDELPWVNVSEVKGFDEEALQLYGMRQLPYTVLLDKEMRIIEKGLIGEPLRERIKELTDL